MKHREMIMVIEAHSEGKAIQVAYANDGDWMDATDPSFNFDSCKYRVKPEYKVRTLGELDDQAGDISVKYVSINALEDALKLAHMPSSDWCVENEIMRDLLEELIK